MTGGRIVTEADDELATEDGFTLVTEDFVPDDEGFGGAGFHVPRRRRREEPPIWMPDDPARVLLLMAVA